MTSPIAVASAPATAIPEWGLASTSRSRPGPSGGRPSPILAASASPTVGVIESPAMFSRSRTRSPAPTALARECVGRPPSWSARATVGVMADPVPQFLDRGDDTVT